MSNTFTFIGSPVAKPRMTRADAWKKRPVVEKYWAFKDNIVLQAKQQHFELGIAYEVTFVVAMPKSMPEKKKLEYDGKAHMIRPDLDNFLKSLNDTLMSEDSSVHYIICNKVWGREAKIIVKNL